MCIASILRNRFGRKVRGAVFNSYFCNSFSGCLKGITFHSLFWLETLSVDIFGVPSWTCRDLDARVIRGIYD